MKILSFILLLCISQLCAQAQETTFSSGSESYLEKRGLLGSLVVIPFSEKMYLSDADASIGRETGLQPGELVVKFRNALTLSLEQELSKDWNISVFHEASSREKGFGMDYIYGSVKYHYVPVSDEVLMDNDTTLKKKEVKKTQKASKQQSGMKEGQVVTVSSNVEKFMDVELANDTLITFLGKQLDSEYYLFINEFDIRYDVTNPDNIASGGLSYKLKVHFSCLDRDGNPVVAGAATTSVQTGESNIYSIIAAAIPQITEKVSRMIRSKKLTMNK